MKNKNHCLDCNKECWGIRCIKCNGKLHCGNNNNSKNLEAIQKISNKAKIRWKIPEYRKLQSERMIGDKNPMKKGHTEKTRLQLSNTWKEKYKNGYHQSLESIEKRRLKRIGKTTSLKGSKQTLIHRQNRSKSLMGHIVTDETRKKDSEAIKKLWATNDEYRENVTSKMLQSFRVRPTSLERQMINIINKNNLPYKYTGDGKFWIGYKNPDFVNVNGEKICIEVGNTFHHKGDYEQKRKEHFAKYGWKCVVIITNKLIEEEVLKILKENNIQ